MAWPLGREFLLGGLLRKFDLGKMPLCLFVRSKLGRASRTSLSDEPHFHLQVDVLDLDLDSDQSSQIES